MESPRERDDMHGAPLTRVAVGIPALLLVSLTACAHGRQSGSSAPTDEVATESVVIFDEDTTAEEYSVDVFDPAGRRRFRCRTEVRVRVEWGDTDDCTMLEGIGGAGAWTLRYRVRHRDGSTEEHDETVVLRGDELHLLVIAQYMPGREGPWVRQRHTRRVHDITVAFRTDDQGKPRMVIVNGTDQTLVLNWAVARPPVILVPSSQDPGRGLRVRAGCGQMFFGPIEPILVGGESEFALTPDDSALATGSYRLVVRGWLVDRAVPLEELDHMTDDGVVVEADVDFLFRINDRGQPYGLIPTPDGF